MALGDMTLTATGRLTADPELRFTPAGLAVCEFTIAVNPRERDAQSGQWRDLDPSFVFVTAWKTLAENCAETLVRGVPVIVSGRWREERWERDGRKGSRWRLTADAVGPNLTLCTAKLAPISRKAAAGGADQ